LYPIAFFWFEIEVMSLDDVEYFSDCLERVLGRQC
jgi:hypothetical protein